MKFGIWWCLGLLSSDISSQPTIFDQDKPLHIGVSIGFASRSHIKYLLEILEEVSQKGHCITYLSADEAKHFGKGYNVTHYSLGDLDMKMGDLGDAMPFTSKDTIMDGFKNLTAPMAEFYRASFPVYERFYIEEKPDLMICDFMANGCIESAARNSIPMMIGYQTLMSSVQSPYFTINGALEPTTIENYTFMQRFKHGIIDPLNLIRNFMEFFKDIIPIRNLYKIPKEYGFPAFSYLGLGIANSFVGFENPTKIPSHLNLIGPISSQNFSSLSEDLELFFKDHSKILYVAFGSLIHINPELAQNLLQHFQHALNNGILDGIVWGGLANTNFDRFPKSFKIDDQEYSTQSMLENTHDKIKLLKWAPQVPILNHPNTKLFLSHGGLDSIYESLDSGTPMLVLPFLADQPRNAILVKENGIGDYIEWPTMGDQVIYEKFVRLLDPNNIQLQSKVRQLQLITKFSSKRKTMAVDLIETYAYSAKSCRMFETPKPFEVPCEMKPFLPLDYKMSSIKANLIDIYIITIFFIFIIFTSTLYISFKALLRIFRGFTKEKLD